MTVRIDTDGMDVPEPYPEVGPLDAPPSDSAAECALLFHGLYWPPWVRALRGIKFGELLYGFWEHRAIWEAMQQAYDAQDWPLEPIRNEHWHAALVADLGAVLLGVVEDHWLDVQGGFHLRTWAFKADDTGYWADRLRRCREARYLINAAQEQAEKAWRLDVDGARRVVSRTARWIGQRIDPVVEIPV